MILSVLSVDSPDLQLHHTQADGDVATLTLRAVAPTAPCPLCGQPSRRVHSRYTRTLTDLPAQGLAARLRLQARRFFCDTAGCPRKVFAERLPGVAAAWARTTARLQDAHRLIGLALGGEAGSRLAGRLSMPTSPDTLLRRVKQPRGEAPPAPRVVGVDDWALRKGQRYGTIVVDLERHQVVDLLPGRDGEALKAWLKGHPAVEVISRDRWAAYAQAAAEAAPQARQVADRWHLLKNLREAAQRLFERHYAKIKEAFKHRQASPPAQPATPTPAGPTDPPPASAPRPTPTAAPVAPSPRQQARDAKRQRRVERYQRARELHQQGQPLRQIATALGLSRNAVRRYLRSDHCPDWRPGDPRPTQLDGLREHVDRRLQEGCRNAAALHRELTAQGCAASYDAVRRFVTRRLAAVGQQRPRANAATCPAPPPPSARKLSFAFLRRPAQREAEDQTRLEVVRDADAELRGAMELAEQFAAMVRRGAAVPLAEWLGKAAQSACPELRGFAEGLRQDEAAVAAALTEPWSNGPVEGHVNRLKVIKRQMYGRAGLALLRARVLHPG